MNKLLAPALIAAVVTAAAALPTFASNAVDPSPQLAAIYSKADIALRNKDIDGCVAYHSPNFLALEPNGQVETTNQERTRLTKLFNTVTIIDVSTHIDKCDYADKTATVIVSQHIKAVVVDPVDQKAIPVSGDDQARELWTKDQSGWQLDVVQTLVPAHLAPDQS